jgi:hypothetical protein
MITGVVLITKPEASWKEMGVALVIVIVLALCVLAPVYGVDSRVVDDDDRRGWWPGSR